MPESEKCEVLSRPHASEKLRTLARKAIAARKTESALSDEEWAEGFAKLVIDGFDEGDAGA